MADEFDSDDRIFGSKTQTQVALKAEAPPQIESGYLLVFADDSCSVFPLTEGGKVVVGRHESCELRFDRKEISRTHCQILTEGGRATVADLGSHNGTWVNGERIVGTSHLVSGDVIGVADITFVFHAKARAERRGEILPFDEFCRRASHDVEQAERMNHGFALVVLALGAEDPDWPRVHNAMRRAVRPGDLIGQGPGVQIVIGMPGLDGAAAQRAAATFISEVQREDIRLRPRAGCASSPIDGSDLDTLLANARAACSAATPGEGSRANAVVHRIEIGERSIVVIEPAMKKLYALIERLAKGDLPVIIHGETGTGKELVAQAIHAWSNKKDGPFVAVNCAALPEGLAESELFGHAKGAFSGAVGAKVGFLESASSGTLFLDEVGELSPSIQAKLLRALETKRIVRIGEVQERIVDLRIVAATNRDLKEEVRAGRFRQDLFFRLSGGTLWLPPLRDRPQELPVMAQVFLDEACRRAGREPMRISDDALRSLRAHAWPGNVRELRNLVEYVATAHPGSVVGVAEVEDRLHPLTHDLVVKRPDPNSTSASPSGPRTFRPIDEELREFEKERMRAALIEAQGNQRRAAKLISMPLRTFQTKMRVYDLKSELRVMSAAEGDRREE